MKQLDQGQGIGLALSRELASLIGDGENGFWPVSPE